MRGYWLPQGYENLSAYDGFFIKSTAIFIGRDAEIDWNLFLDMLKRKTQEIFSDLTVVNAWRRYGNNSRYIVAENNSFQIIADDLDEYVTVYLIVPETAKKRMPKNVFAEKVKILKGILIKQYPNDFDPIEDNAHKVIIH